MKAKNILMSILLAMGSIAAKAAGYPPELALVSQPVLVYNYNSITVYYDVQNIGDYTYRGHVYLYLDPDDGYFYGDKYVKVCPGRIKRVVVEIPAYRPNPYRAYTIMPYYELGDELYSFTTFEYFEPLSFYINGPRNERFVVINVPPRPRYYTRPSTYRYYYDGYRPPMPPPPHGHAYGPATPPPPLNPMHHTYHYHSNSGGYPATHNVNPPAPSNNNVAPQATVRPKANGGSMSSGNNHNNSGVSTSSTTTGSSNSNRPSNSGTSSTGSSSNRPSNSGSVSRPSNSGTSSTGSSSNRPNNSGSVSRPSNSGTSSTGSSSNRPSNSGSVSRPSNSGTSGSSSSRSSNGSSRSGSSSVRSGR